MCLRTTPRIKNPFFKEESSLLRVALNQIAGVRYRIVKAAAQPFSSLNSWVVMSLHKRSLKTCRAVGCASQIRKAANRQSMRLVTFPYLS